MTQHYTKLTVEVSAWCNKCSKHTRHRVLGGKLAECLDCAAKRDKEAAERKEPEPPAEQGRLF